MCARFRCAFMVAHVCTYVFHVHTHMCALIAHAVHVFQSYTDVCPKCTHMRLIARVCVSGDTCVFRVYT